MSTPSSSAVRALALEYKSLQEEPVEGFRVKLLNDDNLFEWEVAIFGPPDTLYQGGYFKVSIQQNILFFLFHNIFVYMMNLLKNVFKSEVIQHHPTSTQPNSDWLVCVLFSLSFFEMLGFFFVGLWTTEREGNAHIYTCFYQIER